MRKTMIAIAVVAALAATAPLAFAQDRGNNPQQIQNQQGQNQQTDAKKHPEVPSVPPPAPGHQPTTFQQSGESGRPNQPAQPGPSSQPSQFSHAGQPAQPSASGPQELSQQDRMRWHDGTWWYWSPENRWMVFLNGQWIGYTPGMTMESSGFGPSGEIAYGSNSIPSYQGAYSVGYGSYSPMYESGYSPSYQGVYGASYGAFSPMYGSSYSSGYAGYGWVPSCGCR